MLQRSIRVLAIAGLMAVVVASLSVAPASAHGCTPGFWKNRAVTLGLYDTSATVGSVFASAPAALAGDTLLEALNYGGGSTLLEKQQILLRAAVAGYLNYVAIPASDYDPQIGPPAGDGFQGTVGEFQAVVNGVLASGSKSLTTSVAEKIDAKNNENAPALCA